MDLDVFVILCAPQWQISYTIVYFAFCKLDEIPNYGKPFLKIHFMENPYKILFLHKKKPMINI